MSNATIGIVLSIWLATSVGCTGNSEAERDSADTITVAQPLAAADAMRNDLDNLARAEEHYYSENQTYTPSLSALDFEISSGITLTIRDVDSTGWWATAQSNSTDATCTIVFGRPIVAPAVDYGEVGCTVPAAVDAMRNDLDNLAHAEERYYSENQTYTPSLSTLDFEISLGITLTIRDVDSTGWWATAQSDSTDATCTIVFGRPIVAPAVDYGEVGCTVN